MHLYNDNELRYKTELEQIRKHKKIQNVVIKEPSISDSIWVDGNEIPLLDCQKINLNAIPAKFKRPVWEWIKQHKPELADMLTNDKTFSSIKNEFDAQVFIFLPLHIIEKIGLL